MCPQLFVRPPIAMRTISPGKQLHPPGSLAIATSMTAVYPYESPGGWHLIGTSPVRFFDAASPKGALLEPGDGVKFRPVTSGEFDRIRAAVGPQRLRS